VKERLARTRLPPGVRVFVDEDESVYLRSALGAARTRALVAVAALFIVVGVTLRSGRLGAVATIAVALAALGARSRCVRRVHPQRRHRAGMAVGTALAVDSAVVVLDAVERRHASGLSWTDAAMRGAEDVCPAVVGALRQRWSCCCRSCTSRATWVLATRRACSRPRPPNARASSSC
jgi:multidrug efflux pump subunit AcrB